MFYRGFDTAAFPGLAAMAALRPHFDFAGYYLAAPSHRDRGFLGHRAALVADGWGLLPIFVGQETVGPGSHVVTAEQGQVDGEHAAEAMAAEGFAAGARVFLDLENGPPFGLSQAAYVGAWLAAVASADMVGGVYASHLLCLKLRAAFPAAPIWAFRVPTVARTSATPPILAPNPALSGCSDAVVWQRRQNVELAGVAGLAEALGRPLLIDLNSAITPDPSAP